MKRRIFLVLLLVALLLSACGAETVKTVEYRGMAFTLDMENGTITHDGTVYEYEADTHGDSTRYTVFYPDGASYSMAWSDYIGGGGGDDRYYDADRLDGDILVDVLRDNLPKEKEPGRFGLCLLVVALGVFYTAAPQAAWYLSRGWAYRNAEPSDAALAVARLSGIVVIIFGVILFFV